MNHSSLLKNTNSVRMLAVAIALSGALLGPSTLRIARADDAAPTYAQAMQAGYNAQTQSHFDEARTQLELAVKLAATPREKALAQLRLGVTLVRLEKFKEAEGMVSELQKVPADVLPKTAALGLSWSLYRAQGQTEEASQVFRQILEANPQQVLGLRFNADGTATVTDANQLRYGSLLGDVKGKTTDQIGAALEALVANPATSRYNRERAKIALGDLLLEDGQPAKARDYYFDVDTSFGGNAPIMMVRILTKIGNTFFAEKNYSDALQAYDRALAVDGVAPTFKHSAQSRRDATARLVKTK